MYNGNPLFRKQGDPGMWLLFKKDKTWCITSTESKNANDKTAYCCCSKAGIDHPSLADNWQMYEDEKWKDHPSIKLKVKQPGEHLENAKWKEQPSIQKLNVKLDYSDSSMRERLQEAKAEWAGIRKKRTLHQHLQPRLLAAVKAVWSVEKKTLTDLVLKVCRDSIISGVARWVENRMLTDSSIRAAAVEDEDVKDTRMRLKKTIESMHHVLGALGSIMRKEEEEEVVMVGKRRLSEMNL